jgi:ubiquinone/menaquinone biosynthesis C-methylase UbiE
VTAVNQAQRDAWNGDSGARWVAGADRRDAVLAPVADAVLAAACIQPDESVSDVGCGCGATTIAAAITAGPGGTAHGIDLSEPMLAVARQRATGAGLTNVTFTAADAQTHPSGGTAFDAVISRFGTMFFDDPIAAFTNIGRAVRPGGRLAIATWQPLSANDWLTIPGAALLRYGTLPDSEPGAPGMFAQADPEVVRATLARAGWTDVDTRAASLTLRIGDDPADATDYLAESGVGRVVLETVPDADKPAAVQAVADALGPHTTDDGVYLDAAIWITSATTSCSR